MQQITCKDREEATEKYITLDGLQGNLTPVKTQSTPASHLLSLLKPSAVQYLLLHLVRMSWPLAGYYEKSHKVRLESLQNTCSNRVPLNAFHFFDRWQIGTLDKLESENVTFH